MLPNRQTTLIRTTGVGSKRRLSVTRPRPLRMIRTNKISTITIRNHTLLNGNRRFTPPHVTRPTNQILQRVPSTSLPSTPLQHQSSQPFILFPTQQINTNRVRSRTPHPIRTHHTNVKIDNNRTTPLNNRIRVVVLPILITKRVGTPSTLPPQTRQRTTSTNPTITFPMGVSPSQLHHKYPRPRINTQ